MDGGLMAKMSGVTRLLAIGAVAAVLVAVFLVMLPGDERKYVTASFPRTVALYEGSDVRILGVPVGEVLTVTPSGTDVTVRMSYDAKYKVPADAEAVIISPAIVGDRYVQLAPVYQGGPVMQDGARLSTRSTSTPLELDEIYQSLDDLNVALGPEGANSDGALTRLLDVTARNFAGQGEQFNQTLRDLGKLTGTLENNKEELFGTVRQVERFVGALAENDQTVRDFNQSLAAASQVLEGERDDLARALRNLGVATKAVASFVRENRDVLSENISGLRDVTDVLVKQRDALKEVLEVAPLALNNLHLTYNPQTGTLDTRANLGENITELETDPVGVLCEVLSAATEKATDETCSTLEQAVGGLGGLRPRSAPLAAPDRPDAASVEPVEVEYVDRSLAGLVAVDR